MEVLDARWRPRKGFYQSVKEVDRWPGLHPGMGSYLQMYVSGECAPQKPH